MEAHCSWVDLGQGWSSGYPLLGLAHWLSYIEARRELAPPPLSHHKPLFPSPLREGESERSRAGERARQPSRCDEGQGELISLRRPLCTIAALRRVVWFSVMSKQMTSPIESIPLHHGDNRGICLREPTALAVVMLAYILFPVVMSFGCLFFFWLA